MAELIVTIYSKPECHLCEEMAEEIAVVARTRPFELRYVNILDDKDALEKYQYEIPVLFVNDRKIAKYRLDRQRFEKALDQAKRAP